MEKQSQRLDQRLSEETGLSRSHVGQWIKLGRVKVDGKTQMRPGLSVKEEAKVEWREPSVEQREVFKGVKYEPEIIAEDDHILVISKDPGIVVHPGAGTHEPTLIERLKTRGELYLVHRLDKDTSGLLLLAKDLPTLERLQNEFKERRIEKHYLALVKGHFEAQKGTVDGAVGRSRKNRIQMSNRADGKSALTSFEVLKVYKESTLLDVRIHTGRTHQIRVHLAGIGHPVAGDPTYGDPDFNEKMRKSIGLKRIFLHSWKLKCEERAWEAVLKKDLEEALKKN